MQLGRFQILLIMPLFQSSLSAEGPLNATVGIGVVDMPFFDGASDRRVMAMPIINLVYKNSLYLGPSRLGTMGAIGYLSDQRKRWVFMGELGYTIPRLERHANHYTGMGDRVENYWVGIGMKRNYGNSYLKISSNFGLKNDSGYFGTIAFGHRLISDRWIFEFTESVTLSDSRNANYDFGISEAQSIKRLELYNNHDNRLDAMDLGSFRGTGGIRDISASANVVYRISNNFNVITNFSGKYLTKKISESPLVRNRTSLSVSTGLLYRF